METRVDDWTGSITIHVQDFLRRFDGKHILKFIFFFDGYLQVFLTEEGVKYPAEKISEGL
jgi:hypothetical protein